MKKSYRTGRIIILSLTVMTALTLNSSAQNTKPGKEAKPSAADTIKKTTDPAALLKAASAIKPFKEIVPANARTVKSFINVHLVSDRYLFEIPDSVLDRDLLIVTRIEKASEGFNIPGLGYSGDESSEAVIRFEKIVGNKISLRSVQFKSFANDTSSNGVSRALKNNRYQTIASIFPVKAFNVEHHSAVIDVTDYFSGDNTINTFDYPFVRSVLANIIPDKSFLERIDGFPTNIEIKSVKTFNMKPTPLDNPPPVSIEFNNSLVMLPKYPMRPRLADPRIGFFSNSYIDFDIDPHGVSKTAYIWRWRMEPKPEDMEKYKRGELVEPRKPIVIYIDPATPKVWVPYLIAGINDWQVAFEKAGFKNAVRGEMAPVNDSTFSILDARNSVLIYKPSDVANASGPSVKDPRTGEILETHINWYHSVMTLVQQWYTLQAGAIDPRAQKSELDEKLMGQLIRFVSSHEIGHTLGLMHNFGASSTVPVENLRNKAWVEEHGHTPSIMDYARFNYVAQPEDHISEKGIFPRIGDYDKWAIEYGYRLIPQANSAEAEKPFLNTWVIEKLRSGKQFFYGSQVGPLDNSISEINFDPRDQNEDLGDDAMKAGIYGIKNLKRIEPNIVKWTSEPYENYSKAGELYQGLVNQYNLYMNHVYRNIGGIYTTPKTSGQPGSVFEIVPKLKQKRALAFLNAQLFRTPTWLIDNKIYNLTSKDYNVVIAVQRKILTALLGARKLDLLTEEAEQFPGQSYPLKEMLKDLNNGIFSELRLSKSVTIYRRNLQKIYVNCLIAYLAKPGAIESDTYSNVKAHARTLDYEIREGKHKPVDTDTKEHYADLDDRLQQALKPKS